jgi:bifunctional non-homologous end joining protein LigD
MVDYDGVEVMVSHPGKVMFPRDGLTKGDVIAYYSGIALVMLPHMSGRPVSMLRYPNGIDGKSFFHKDVSDRFPPWFRTVKVDKKDGQIVHPVCEKRADLVYLANLACLTPHLWLSKEGSLGNPDRMILDMDPFGTDFAIVKDAARMAAQLLREIGLEPFVMTTGSRGLHVTTPLDPSAPFTEVLALARTVASRMTDADERLTTERLKDARGGRLLVDVFRNSYAQTAVAPYALRARDGAPVATPVDWRELDDLDRGSQSFNLGNIMARIGTVGDPWKDIDRHTGSVRSAVAASRK